MKDWNVVVTVHADRFISACEQLEPLARVEGTNYYNILVMRVGNVEEFLRTLGDWMQTYADAREALARVAPARDTFVFQDPDDFRNQTKEILRRYADQLDGVSFHIRVHRRGWKEKMSTTALEKELGSFLFDEIESHGAVAKVDFDDPDAIVVIDTVDNRAGMAMWSRDELQRFPFLKPD
jgi:tRNA(Ser,Leu) C12 N-acetylase TAN1